MEPVLKASQLHAIILQDDSEWETGSTETVCADLIKITYTCESGQRNPQ